MQAEKAENFLKTLTKSPGSVSRGIFYTKNSNIFGLFGKLSALLLHHFGLQKVHF
jgi:hypothetical protein